jgi:CheY-like chemotaxis protein
VPTGDVLVQLPSGTWIRDTCSVCHGWKKVHRAELARRSAQAVDEPTEGAVNVGQRKASGTRPRVARVLVVHDEPLFAKALRLALSDEFEVKVATDVHQALASMMAGDWYDVVLCEVMMPGINGVELRNLVHATSPELAARIVFIAGVLPERVRLLLESVPNTCLEKPVNLPALCDLIRRRSSPGMGTVHTGRAGR